MKEYRYPIQEISREIWRAGLGIVVTAVPLLLLQPSSVIVYILGCLLCLFVLYGVRAFDRQIARICISDQNISITGIRTRAIEWEALERLDLSYFSTRRDGEKGWMQLKLTGKGVRLRIESTVTDFEDLVGICVSVAAEKRVSLSATTRRNLDILGVMAASGYSDNLQFGEKSS